MKNKNPIKLAIILWSMLTVFVAASILFIFLRWGEKGFGLFIQLWPLEDLHITLASVMFTWLLLGSLIYLLYAKRINANNGWGVAGFFLMGLPISIIERTISLRRLLLLLRCRRICCNTSRFPLPIYIRRCGQRSCNSSRRWAMRIFYSSFGSPTSFR